MAPVHRNEVFGRLAKHFRHLNLRVHREQGMGQWLQLLQGDVQ